MPHVQTVLGPIDPAELGPTLMHEHLLCDIRPPSKRAPEHLGPEIRLDTVLFLGDGAASAGDCLFRERIRERVRQALRLRPVVLHAVAFGSRPADRAFLEDLAALSGGRWVER